MMQEMGPTPMPEMGPQITPPTPEVLPVTPESPVSVDITNIEKGGRAFEKPPQVEEKYKVEKIRPEQPEENIEEKIREAKQELDEKFGEEEPGPQTKTEGQNYYEILGISPNASPEEIKDAYRKLARETHPDAGGDVEEFKRVNEAFENLSNQDKRDQYDIKLGQKSEETIISRQDMNPFYEQMSTIHDLYGSSILTEEHIIKSQAMELIRERERNLAIEERWSLFSDQEKEKYNNDIEKFGAELEEKRREAQAKLYMSGDTFYNMCRRGYKPENCKRYGFFVPKIEIPFLDGGKPLIMPEGKFHGWLRDTERSIEDSIKKKADEIADKISKSKTRR